MTKRTINDHWKDIFYEYNVLHKINTDGYFKISANAIKAHKEPRLMTKFDNSKSRPKVFKENNLSILPIDNGEYMIGRFDLYQKLEKKDVQIREKEFPDFYESLDISNIYSESNALVIAEISGMIEDIAKEDVKQTIRGRMRADEFKFNVNNESNLLEVDVRRPQIEVDGGYESINKIIVVEAKNLEPEDFIIRQLYYPYRFWKMRVEKEIIPVFLTFKNGVYTFYIYEFLDLNNYNSLKLKDKISYRIKPKNPMQLDFDAIQVYSTKSKIQFPQADSFNRIIELLMILKDGPKSIKELTNIFDITPRQTNYYVSAGMYLGLVLKNRLYELSTKGNEISRMKWKERDKNLVQLILSHKPFNDAYKIYQRDNSIPNKNRIKKILISEAGLKDNSTASRRASTLKGWLTWVINSGVLIN